MTDESEEKYKNITDDMPCWICKRTNKELKVELPDMHKCDGVQQTDCTSRNMTICGMCKDIVTGVMVQTSDELYAEDVVYAILFNLFKANKPK